MEIKIQNNQNSPSGLSLYQQIALKLALTGECTVKLKEGDYTFKDGVLTFTKGEIE